MRAAAGAFGLAVVLATLPLIGAAAAAGPYQDPLAKLDGTLRRLVEDRPGSDLEAQAHLLIEPDDRVAVEIRGSGGGDLRRAAVALGGRPGAAYADLLDATVPVRSLERLAARADVGSVRRPIRLRKHAVALQSLSTTNAQAWQTAGFRGEGVKVAVVDLGFAGYQDKQRTGDLPATLVTTDFCAGQLTASGIDHGTAVAEIVHKMAPAAQLYLVCARTNAAVGMAKDYVRSQGIPIVNFSAGNVLDWRGDGMGGAGTVDGIVADARAAGILWVASAGNYGAAHWSGTFSPAPASGLLASFTAGGDAYQRFTLPANTQVCGQLRWDSWPVTSIDYDLQLFDMTTGTPRLVGSSSEVQNGSQPPVEEVCYSDPVTRPLALAIARKSTTTSTTTRIDLFVDPVDISYPIARGSVANPAGSPSALAVGAMCWAENTIAWYSSQGPMLDGRTKPDIAGPASVSTSTYGQFGSCDGGSGFPGTSASAPHVSGAAALVKQANPAFTAAQLQAFLEGRATDLGATGKDNVFGSGKLQLGVVPATSPSASPSPTPTPAPTSPPVAAVPTKVYLPNITRMLGGPDGWQTPFIVQNVGTVATDLTMSFYSFADGSLVRTRSVAALRPGTSVFHDPNSDTALPAGGQFSVVVQSTSAPIVAVVNEHQNVQNAARQEALSYGGLSSGSTVVSLPYVAKNVGGWLTTFIMQNLGSATATVSAKFVGPAGTVTLARTIGPGRSGFVDPTVEALLANGSEYAVILTSDQPIAVVVNAHNDAATVQFPRGFSYNGIPASSVADQFLPYVARNADAAKRTSRLLVQNSGLAAAAPRLYFRKLDATAVTSIALPLLQPGAATSFDPTSAAQLADGEYSLHVTGGQFAVVNATTSASRAMGYTSGTAYSETIYLPNVTRTLGGPGGWTTPIVVQQTSAFLSPITVKWYRFSDGTLVLTQTLTGLGYGVGRRIDPRQVSGLSDDAQYAVVVSAPLGAHAIVTELNPSGGDGDMIYEGFMPSAGSGTNACLPTSGPAGTTFWCSFGGLPKGAAATLTLGSASGGGTPESVGVTAADGSWSGMVGLAIEGQRTVTIAAGGISRSAQVTVGPATFAVQVTQASNGSVQARTTPGLPCLAVAILANGIASTAAGLEALKTADGSGVVSWIYTPDTAPTGTATMEVRCASGSLILLVRKTYSVP